MKQAGYAGSVSSPFLLTTLFILLLLLLYQPPTPVADFEKAAFVGAYSELSTFPLDEGKVETDTADAAELEAPSFVARLALDNPAHRTLRHAEDRPATDRGLDVSASKAGSRVPNRGPPRG